MPLDCSNANSLFELGFGANAVVAILSEKVNNARGSFLDKYYAAILEANPSLKKERIDRPEIRELIVSGAPPLRMLLRLATPLQLCSLAMVLTSIATLYQAALWGPQCKLTVTGLTLYCVLAFLALPFAYFSFAGLLDSLTKALMRATVESSGKFLAALIVDTGLCDQINEVELDAIRLAIDIERGSKEGSPTEELNARMDALAKRAKELHAKQRDSYQALKQAFRSETGAA